MRVRVWHRQKIDLDDGHAKIYFRLNILAIVRVCLICAYMGKLYYPTLVH